MTTDTLNAPALPAVNFDPETIARHVCRAVAELGDRNSPEDRANMMLVTRDELFGIVIEAFADNAEARNLEGGRESVEDALAIVESFGPGTAGVNDTFARQILLAAEVVRLRALAARSTTPSPAAPIANNDPAVRWTTQTIEITYRWWDFSTTAMVDIKGNCFGFSVMESAVSTHGDQLFEAQGEYPTLVLRRPAEDGDGEDTLECTPDGDEIDEWLEKMCVGVRIVAREPYEPSPAAPVSPNTASGEQS